MDAARQETIEPFFERSAATVAPELLGSVVRCNGVAIRLSEVEAYSGLEDPASHAYRGPTPRTEVMFGPPGRVYVYFVYGMHWAVNLVCHPDGQAGAVLLRAGEVVEGIEAARSRRGADLPVHRLARGPGNLASSLGVRGEVSGTTLWDGPLTWSPAPAAHPHETGPRVGVAAAQDVVARFWLSGDPSVSAYRRHTPRQRRGGATARTPGRGGRGNH